jgi:hypothetical protein
MATWSWPATAPADPNRSLRVFTLSPNWKDGILERLEFKTDLMSSEQAVEQRRASRRFPRRSFEVSFLRADSERSRIDLFAAGMGRNKFLVPLWHDQFKLGEPGAYVQFPTSTLVHREFHVDDLVLITAGERFAVLTVLTVNTGNDRITLGSLDDVGTWPVGSRITPLRVARILDPMSLGNASDRVGKAQIRFSLSDADSRFTASWGYCSPLWRFVPDRATEIEFSYERSAYILDMDAGVVEVTDPGNRAQISTSLALTMYGHAEIGRFRSFLYQARGKVRRFYVPSFTRDIIPLDDLSGDIFDAVVNGFNAYMPDPQEARRIISVVFKDGRPTIYRDIIGIEPVLNDVAPYNQVAERFTLASDMPPILKREIDRISFIVPSRFDQDSFEILHVTDSGKGAKAAVVVKSNVVEGMPPIECWVTSRPYPLQNIDEMTMGAVLTVSDLRFPPAWNDSMDCMGVFTEGTLNTVLLSGDAGFDEMDFEGLLTSGALVTLLLTGDAGFDSIDDFGTLTSGSLIVLLITHIIDPADEIAVVATLTEGTLT